MPVNTDRTGDAVQVPPDGRILWFARDAEAFGFLSHFHPSPFSLDGETWPTVEHYYQAQKSHDPDYRTAILAAATPDKAKRLSAHPGRPRREASQSWFRRHGRLPRPDWDDVRLDVMRRADFAKYAQNPELAALLLATGDAEIVEDNPRDPVWGIGPDGKGENWAGRVLMEVRKRLRCGKS